MSEPITMAGFHFSRMKGLKLLCQEKSYKILDLIEQEDFDSARILAETLAGYLARARDRSNLIADNYADLSAHQIEAAMRLFSQENG